MAQTEAPRRERIERSLKRLGHKLEKRGRGYQIKDAKGTVVSGKTAIALDAVEGWIAEYVKPKVAGYRPVQEPVPNSGAGRIIVKSTPVHGEVKHQKVTLTVHLTEAELAHEARLLMAGAGGGSCARSFARTADLLGARRNSTYLRGGGISEAEKRTAYVPVLPREREVQRTLSPARG
jgi:hypothetical protein